MFCDDLTVIIKKRDMEETLNAISEAFASVGLRVNQSKTDFYGLNQVRTQPFVLLGADLACTGEFSQKQLQKQQ